MKKAPANPFHSKSLEIFRNESKSKLSKTTTLVESSNKLNLASANNNNNKQQQLKHPEAIDSSAVLISDIQFAFIPYFKTQRNSHKK